jgi:DNA-binding MarR family transcriptional regulator
MLVALAEQSGLSPQAAEAVAAIDAVLSRIRRAMQRRDFGRLLLAQVAPELDVAHLDAISVISGSPTWGPVSEDSEVTVGTIAERLGIDPSRASRLAAEIVERGYVQRIASQADARRIVLQLTDRGRSLVSEVRTRKWQTFAGSMRNWTEDELVTFARLLDRFSTWTAPPIETGTQADKSR